jgi:oligopeptide/dipeptide ABC transporter ATP-binding protein
MYLGRIVEQGPAEEVTRNPVHPYTQALIAAVPSLSGKSNTSIIRGEPASPLNPPAGCAYHPRCPVRITTCSIERPMLMALDGQPDISVACVHTKEGR